MNNTSVYYFGNVWVYLLYKFLEIFKISKFIINFNDKKT